jgi:3,4-dihydroxy-2-butanone 4-phosphate synthase
MTQKNETPYGTAFTVSIEAREGVTTGISAADRDRARGASQTGAAREYPATFPVDPHHRVRPS